MREVLIIGGGVIGLTTAVLLAEDGVQVRVWSREPVAETTSAVAGGLCWPYRIEPERLAVQWAVRAFGTFAELSARPAETGVRMVPGVMADGWAPSAWTELVGLRSVTPLVDMTTYLPYLLHRLEAAGGRYEEHSPSSLEEAAAEAPALVNCTGLGARELVADTSLVPVRGQLVIVENPGLKEWYVAAEPGSPDSTYILPQPYGVILGGTAEEGDWGTRPDSAIAERILARCVRVRPTLAGVPVLAHRVGLRPYRHSGVRLEAEQLPGGGLVLHHYGHGGAGLTVSWGSAQDAARILRDHGNGW